VGLSAAGVLVRVLELGRIEELPLQLGTGARHQAGTNNGVALECGRNRPQEGIT
jgi:hypothetical protein